MGDFLRNQARTVVLQTRLGFFAFRQTAMSAMDQDLARQINGDEDEDEALRRAIALSMGQSEEQVDLASDAVPSKAGEAGPHPGSAIHIDLTSEPTHEAKETAPVPGSSSSILGLNRKKMEAERLARIQKRKATSDHDDAGLQPPQQKVKRSGGPTGIVPVHLQREIAERQADPSAKKDVALIKDQATPVPAGSELPFPRGVVKKTWVYGQPRGGDDIKIEEVFQKNDLELAVLSSFQWDDDWLMSKINLRKTKVLLIAYASDEAEVRVYLAPPSAQLSTPTRRNTHKEIPQS